MNGSPFVVPFLASLAAALCTTLSGCASTQTDTADLAANPRLYQDLPFATKSPGDRAAFVTPIGDVRDLSKLPKGERGTLVAYDDDSAWARPVRDMVEDVLRRELLESGVFAAIVPAPEATALVVKPTIVQFAGGTIELPQGGRSLGDVGIRLQVWGPQENGKRALLLDEVYADRHLSPIAMLPTSPMFLQGRALRGAVSRALAGLDGSNVARSGVPLDVTPAAEEWEATTVEPKTAAPATATPAAAPK